MNFKEWLEIPSLYKRPLDPREIGIAKEVWDFKQIELDRLKELTNILLDERDSRKGPKVILDMVAYALLFVGTPYGWGKDGGGQFDCSGFVQEVLEYNGLDPKGDQTADGLLKILSKTYDPHLVYPEKTIVKGSLLFFGNRKKATHVAIALDRTRMIEAGGGGRKTLTTIDASLHAAMVRIRQISSRGDLIAIINL